MVGNYYFAKTKLTKDEVWRLKEVVARNRTTLTKFITELIRECIQISEFEEKRRDK